MQAEERTIGKKGEAVRTSYPARFSFSIKFRWWKRNEAASVVKGRTAGTARRRRREDVREGRGADERGATGQRGSGWTRQTRRRNHYEAGRVTRRYMRSCEPS